ncbi:MAG: hypothetical protein LBQ12_03330 [Deltaproteobacteria bacterium]|jgi:putative transposase|nr:hypothetical protein [Deltaproteobacteria bacterium]
MAVGLPAFKKKFPRLKEVPSQTLRQTLRLLDVAIARGFRSGAGFPGFRRWGRPAAIAFPDSAASPAWRLGRKNVFPPKMAGRGVAYGKYRPFAGKPRQLEIVPDRGQRFIVVACLIKDRPLIGPDRETAAGLTWG